MTLFPDLVNTVLSESIIGRAQKSGAMELHVYNIRDYSMDKHNRVDDTPYGGGKGMLMMAPPIYRCYEAVSESLAQSGFTGRKRVIYLSPTGRVLTQKRAAELAADYDDLILLCGHYEGIDTRVIDEIVDEEISIGDFVLTGGEIAAMAGNKYGSEEVEGLYQHVRRAAYLLLVECDKQADPRTPVIEASKAMYMYGLCVTLKERADSGN